MRGACRGGVLLYSCILQHQHHSRTHVRAVLDAIVPTALAARRKMPGTDPRLRRMVLRLPKRVRAVPPRS
jgi:hypothetical protein